MTQYRQIDSIKTKTITLCLERVLTVKKLRLSHYVMRRYWQQTHKTEFIEVACTCEL